MLILRQSGHSIHNKFAQLLGMGAYALILMVLTIGLTACEDDTKKANQIKQLSIELMKYRQETGRVPVANKQASALYGEVIDLVAENYLYKFDEEKLFKTTVEGMRSDVIDPKSADDNQIIEAGIRAALESLDKYSTYYNKVEFRQFNESISGEFGGLGIEVRSHPLGLEVVNAIEGSPAERVGLDAFDIIIQAGETRLNGLELEKIINMLRGPVNSKITLKVLKRNSAADPIPEGDENLKQAAQIVELRREIIQVKSVRTEILPNKNIAYINIRQFNDHSGDEMIKALNDLQGQSKNLSGLIVDVRGNPGGIFSQALVISDAFLTSGEIASTLSRSNRYSYKADKDDYSYNLPVVVLIDKDSASASEIFAGAIQDLKRGILIGEKSYGKGLVQTLFPLDNGGGVKLTTSEYHTASGHPVGVGIEPDITFADDPETPDDEVLLKAIEYLSTQHG